MIQETRTKVLWVGGHVLSELRSMTLDWGLALLVDPAPLPPPSDPGLRAVLVWHSGKSIGELRHRITPFVEALDHGVLVAIVAENNEAFAAALRFCSYLAKETEAETKEAFDGIRTLQPQAAEIVRACVEHDPGPTENPGLTVDDSLTPVETLLFRRAFARFSKLSLSRQSGGRSGTSSVWRVDAHDSHGYRCEPFIAKVGHKLALKEERDTFRASVREYLPFPFRPSMMAQGFVAGKTRAILCSMFISRAQCFDRYVCSVKYPELVVSALFDGPLRTWRSNRSMVKKRLGRIYVDQAEAAARNEESDRRLGRPNRAVLPNMDRLREAYELAKKEDSKVPPPQQLWKDLRAMSPIPYAECGSHGDLNARNIFVRSTSVDVVLIDFSHAGDRGPSSRDPSRLDVNLAFDVGGRCAPMLSDTVLESLYRSPLLAGHARPEAVDGRIEAIRQIRRHAAGEGIRNREYEVTTACHLMRYARSDSSQNTARQEFGENEEQRLRRISYVLAVRLLEGLRTRNSKR